MPTVIVIPINNWQNIIAVVWKLGVFQNILARFPGYNFNNIVYR